MALRYLVRQKGLRSDFRKILLQSLDNSHHENVEQLIFDLLDSYDTPVMIFKRNGELITYSENKIRIAISKAIIETGDDISLASTLAAQTTRLNKAFEEITVDICQNNVQFILISSGLSVTSMAYSEYLHKHQKLREKSGGISTELQDLVDRASHFHIGDMEFAIYLRTYSRWIDEKNRREMWPETVDRFFDMVLKILPPLDSQHSLTTKEFNEIKSDVLHFRVLPSMRALQFAGKAAMRENVHCYNCCYVETTTPKFFADLFYISMCGTGVAFSVEKRVVNQLPIPKYPSDYSIKKNPRNDETEEDTFTIIKPEDLFDDCPIHIIADSRKGWAESLRIGMENWLNGKDLKFDYRRVRPLGARLVTTGGTASGPGPLKDLLDFTRETILRAGIEGRRLKPIEVHDINCKIGKNVQVGGVRRSAMLSLSDLDDIEMRDCKSGPTWYTEHPHRQIANNSAVYLEKPSEEQLTEEFMSMVRSMSGERGIFNRGGMKNTINQYRQELIGDMINCMGTNPCGEINLVPYQFCNLTKVVCKWNDTPDELYRKQKNSAILGTIQSMMTNFRYISKEFKENTEKERLLGCSLGGQYQCPAVRDPIVQNQLRRIAEHTNRIYSKRFGVSASSSVTCVKPDGNSSVCDGSSSGISPVHSQYYIRHTRFPLNDPVARLLKDQGIPYGQTEGSFDSESIIFCWPIESPKGSIYRESLGAIAHLEFWKMVKIHYCKGHHNPSITINYKPEEVPLIIAWLYENWEIIGGISFLPFFEGGTVYKHSMLPYQTITKEEYDDLKSRMPKVNYAKIVYYEDNTNYNINPKETAACSGGLCERF